MKLTPHVHKRHSNVSKRTDPMLSMKLFTARPLEHEMADPCSDPNQDSEAFLLTVWEMPRINYVTAAEMNAASLYAAIKTLQSRNAPHDKDTDPGQTSLTIVRTIRRRSSSMTKKERSFVSDRYASRFDVGVCLRWSCLAGSQCYVLAMRDIGNVTPLTGDSHSTTVRH